MPTPPTAVTGVDLVAGTGTRAFTAVTTQAGDYLVVGIQVEAAAPSENYTPSSTGVTFPGTADVDSNNSNSSNGRAIIWVGQETGGGGSRTVTITPSAGTKNYRARLTVVRGSDGPGTGKGSSSTAQTVSITRQGANSMIFMGVTDWSAGAVGTPTWTPGGTTQASQQQSGVATYIFGRWDDSGSTGTASHGISTPTYTTPAVAVLEMLGTTSAAPAPDPTWLRFLQPPGRFGPLDPISKWEPWLGTGTTTLTPYVVGTPTTISGSAITSTALGWDAGAVAGDMLLSWIGEGGGNQAITSNSLGMTQINRVDNGNSTASLILFMKVLTASDISAGSVTFTWAASQRWSISNVIVRNHNSSIDVIGTATNGTNVSPVTVNSATGNFSNELAMGAVGGQVNATSTDTSWTWGGSLVEIVDIVGTGAVSRSFLSVAQQQLPGPPPTSGPDTTTPVAAVNYGAFRILIAPPQSSGEVHAVAVETDVVADVQNAATKAAPTSVITPVAAVGTNAVVKVGLALTVTPIVAVSGVNRSNSHAVAVTTTVVAVSTNTIVHKSISATNTPVVLVSTDTIKKKKAITGITPVVVVSTDTIKKLAPVPTLTPVVIVSADAIKKVVPSKTTTPVTVVSTDAVVKKISEATTTTAAIISITTRGAVPKAVVAFSPIVLASSNAIRKLATPSSISPIVLVSTDMVRKRALATPVTPVIAISTVVERKIARPAAIAVAVLTSNQAIIHKGSTRTLTSIIVISTDKIDRPIEFGVGIMSEGRDAVGIQASGSAELGTMTDGAVATGRQG